MADGEKYDLMIAVVSALTLIFMIMLLLTRSVVAALVIVGTASQLDRRVLRAVGVDLAGPVRHPHPLDRDGAVGHHPVGRRLRLQPAAGLPVQRRDPRRTQDRIHPVDGRHRRGGDVRGSGVRLHDGGDAGQRPDACWASSARRSASVCCSTPWSCARCSCRRSPPCWAAGSGGRRLSIRAVTTPNRKPPPAPAEEDNTAPLAVPTQR